MFIQNIEYIKYIYRIFEQDIYHRNTRVSWPDLHFTTDYILYNWVCDE